MKANPKRSPQSRGLLPVKFLTGAESPVEFLSNLDLHNYAQLNLLTAKLSDEPQVALLSSTQGNLPHVFEKGVHGISNGRLNDPTWCKVEQGKAALERILHDMAPGSALPFDAIFEDVLGNSVEVKRGVALPDTGLPESAERKFSPVRIKPFWNFKAGGLYGTVSQIVLAVWSDKTVEIRERIWDADQLYRQQNLSFSLRQPPSL